MRYMARAVALIWALWWTYFGFASGLGERLSVGAVFLHAALPGLVFLAVAVFAWRYEAIGGLVLVMLGLFVCIAYPLKTCERFPLGTILFVVATMGLPPLLSGVLSIASSQRPRTMQPGRGSS